MEKIKMEWINTTGGPLICGEREVGLHWRGTKGRSVDDGDATKTDYERACTIAEYIQRLRCNEGDILVLGDEPLQSTFILMEKGELAIARWIYLQPRQNAETILKMAVMEADEICAPPIHFNINYGELILFDAACDGIQECKRYIKANLQQGRYVVTTEKRERNRMFSFLIHRFISSNNAFESR
jgi:hypothetical protein